MSTYESEYRLVILGGGPAGTFAARAAAARGSRVALVLPELRQPEADDPATPQRTEFAGQIRGLQTQFGLTAPNRPLDESNVDVFHGRPVFVRRRVVKLGERELRFRKALIATGATTAGDDVEGSAESGCLTSEMLGSITEPPRRLAVIGSDAVACQWAQAFCRFGSQVHLVAREPTILPREDADAAAIIQARFAKDGVRLHLGCRDVAIESTGNLRGVVIGRDGRREKLLVDRILLCGPRCANTQGLGLEAVAVDCNPRGVLVDDRLRTTNRDIYAAGAVCGPEYAAPAAARASARLAADNALRFFSRRMSRLVIPRLIDTRPKLVQAGLTLGEAQARELQLDTYRIELAEADASLAAQRRQGFVAMHVARRRWWSWPRIVGATVVADGADELIAPLLLLMTSRRSPAALADVIPCHPSRFELLRQLGRRYIAGRRD